MGPGYTPTVSGYALGARRNSSAHTAQGLVSQQPSPRLSCEFVTNDSVSASLPNHSGKATFPPHSHQHASRVGRRAGHRTKGLSRGLHASPERAQLGHVINSSGW